MKIRILIVCLMATLASLRGQGQLEDCTAMTALPVEDAIATIALDTPFLMGSVYTYCVEAEVTDFFVLNNMLLGQITVTNNDPTVTDLPASITVFNRSESDALTVVDQTGEGAELTEGDVYFIEVTANSVGSSTIAFVPTPAIAGLFPAQSVQARVIDPAALPVTWGADLTARPEGKLNRFSWSVTAQENVDTYELQREVNGRFETVEYIAPLGEDMLGEVFYEAFDQQLSQGARYRVRQQDYDGAFSFSNTIYVAPASGAGISIFPNPAQDFVTIQSPVSLSRVTLHNVLGSLIASYRGGSDRATIPVADLPAGIYLVATTDETGDRSVRRLRVR